MRRLAISGWMVGVAAWLLASAALLPAAEDQPTPLPPPDQEGWISLLNGKDLGGWKFRDPDAADAWIVCNAVRLNPEKPYQLLPDDTQSGPPAILCRDGSDIMTVHDFYNYELHLEFTIPEESNSGVYNRGLYEIQVLDSYGKKELGFHDCGALYERAKPEVNPAKPPGEWQTFDIKLVGRQLSLKWNGVEIYKDHDVRYGETDRRAFLRLTEENSHKPPELQVKLQEKDGRYFGYFGNGGTRGSLPGADRPGPILLQGDHGPVAYRNIKIRPLPDK